MKSISVLVIFVGFLLVSVQAQISEEVTFTHQDKTVFATFSRPEGPGAFPTIILAPGSGPNDRDGTLFMTGANVACLYPNLLNETLYPYRELAAVLVDSGYAVLRYDKLEYTYPTSLGAITFEKLWLPVNSAVDYIKTRSDVDSTQIILIGHSEGGSLIPYVAAHRHDIRALISIAGPRTPFDSILAYQLVNIAETCNGNVPLAQAQANQILAYYQIIRTNNWNQTTPDLFGVPAETWYKYLQVTDSVAHFYNQANLPTLFLGLGLDINVPPAELDRFKMEVTSTEDFWLVENLNHYLTPMDDPKVSVALTDTIVYWLRLLETVSTSFRDQTSSLDIQVHPNPTASIFQVKTNQHLFDVSLEVFSSQGIQILSLAIPDWEKGERQVVSLDQEADGWYHLRIMAGGNLIWSQKLIKNNSQ